MRARVPAKNRLNPTSSWSDSNNVFGSGWSQGVANIRAMVARSCAGVPAGTASPRCEAGKYSCATEMTVPSVIRRT
jgi:hypothetical protein